VEHAGQGHFAVVRSTTHSDQDKQGHVSAASVSLSPPRASLVSLVPPSLSVEGETTSHPRPLTLSIDERALVLVSSLFLRFQTHPPTLPRGVTLSRTRVCGRACLSPQPTRNTTDNVEHAGQGH
jgi:hypothetical protein